MLSTEDRKKVYRGLMRYWSNLWTKIDMNKSDLLEAVNATDDWIEANHVSFNNSLPPIAKANLSAEQKTLMFCCVALARQGIKFLRSMVGQVD